MLAEQVKNDDIRNYMKAIGVKTVEELAIYGSYELPKLYEWCNSDQKMEFTITLGQ